MDIEKATQLMHQYGDLYFSLPPMSQYDFMHERGYMSTSEFEAAEQECKRILAEINACQLELEAVRNQDPSDFDKWIAELVTGVSAPLDEFYKGEMQKRGAGFLENGFSKHDEYNLFPWLSKFLRGEELEGWKSKA